MEEKLHMLQKEALQALEKVQTQEELRTLEHDYFGRKGKINEQTKALAALSEQERPIAGKKVNEVREILQKMFEERKQKLDAKLLEQSLTEDWIDITAPGRRYSLGHIHPISKLQREVEHIFSDMGFMIADGPEVENEWYNFEQLNIPSWHPARDIQDTFYVHNKLPEQEGRTVLRTHTSPGQVRNLERYGAPLRMIIPGRCFRHEATDASHGHTFYQVEGMLIDRNISVAHLKGVMTEFLTRLFHKNITVRFRPGYFPFTEPSLELDFSCLLCGGTGCRVCKWTGWMEFMGCGQTRACVIRASGVDPKKFQGWAFGFGLDRLAMMRYDIDDIRLFLSGDLRFLTQF